MELAEAVGVTQEEAVRQKVPTELIERRERKCLRRPSALFLGYISHVETVYMENMNIDNMVAYADGNLLEEIKTEIMKHPCLRVKFLGLFPASSDTSDNTKQEIMGYVLKKFKCMRGKWFSKAIKGQVGKMHQKIEKAATRDAVGAKGMAAKKAAEAVVKSELKKVKTEADLKEELYSSAKQNIIDVIIEEEKDGADFCDEDGSED